MKEFKVQVPEGYEIDKENSTFECIKFIPIKDTYDSIVKKLFLNKTHYKLENEWVTNIRETFIFYLPNALLYGTSKKQLEKLLAINKLLNVAKYLNGDWKPDWKNKTDYKWYIENDEGHIKNNIVADYTIYYNSRICYFKTQGLAKQAIEILGEDVIRLALSTDW